MVVIELFFLNKCIPNSTGLPHFKRAVLHSTYTTLGGAGGSYFDLAYLLQMKIIWTRPQTWVPNIGTYVRKLDRDKKHPRSKYGASACFERHRPYRLLQFSPTYVYITPTSNLGHGSVVPPKRQRHLKTPIFTCASRSRNSRFFFFFSSQRVLEGSDCQNI